MQFVPYSISDAPNLLNMMSHHFDFTPELDTIENSAANHDYIKKIYYDPSSDSMIYVLKSDSSIVGYISANIYSLSSKNLFSFCNPCSMPESLPSF